MFSCECVACVEPRAARKNDLASAARATAKGVQWPHSFWHTAVLCGNCQSAEEGRGDRAHGMGRAEQSRAQICGTVLADGCGHVRAGGMRRLVLHLALLPSAPCLAHSGCVCVCARARARVCVSGCVCLCVCVRVRVSVSVSMCAHARPCPPTPNPTPPQHTHTHTHTHPIASGRHLLLSASCP